ncbi:hypothetical protein F2P81_020922 [Scophthalmus maximus]|uniref:DNA-directed DNA polymerase n=1 Tax=Scophthalmus maximus TaxID=52904 RepID=A0A6A4S1P3_SCOMX|nr:hypothetical protein F2P81_020922 [Scophthalmus maximus]
MFKLQLRYYVPLTGPIKPHECSKLNVKFAAALLKARPTVETRNRVQREIDYYDFEAYLDAKGVHVPFLICTKTLDSKTWNAYGEACAVRFILHFRRPLFKNSVFIAHNSRGFESYLLIKAMLTLNILPGFTMQGSKVICFTDDEHKHNIHHCLRTSNSVHLQQPQERALSFDTDSMIYVSKEGESQLKLGNYLGDLTDELEGDRIVEFAAAGPKSYAYKTKNNRVSMRVKGITQTHECSERVHFDSVKELVEGFVQNNATEAVLETPQHNIKGD